MTSLKVGLTPAPPTHQASLSVSKVSIELVEMAEATTVAIAEIKDHPEVSIGVLSGRLIPKKHFSI